MKSDNLLIDELREVIRKLTLENLLMKCEMDILIDDPTSEPSRKILDRYRAERKKNEERETSVQN